MNCYNSTCTGSATGVEGSDIVLDVGVAIERDDGSCIGVLGSSEMDDDGLATRLGLILATTLDRLLVTATTDALSDALPSSATLSILVCLLLKSGRGINLVHQRAIRRPRSMNRCLSMKRTTRMKNMNAERMIKRSSQSAFSRVVMSCLEVSISELRTSCVCDVARNVVVDSSSVAGQYKTRINWQ